MGLQSHSQLGRVGLNLKSQPTSLGKQGMEESALWIWDAVWAREAGLGRHPRFCNFKVWGAHLGEALLILASLWFCRKSNRLDEASVYLATDLERHFLINNSSLSICYT